MDSQQIALIVLAGGLIYETVMYLYRKWQNTGEKFSIQQYAQTFGYVALLAVAAYVTTGVIPDVNSIISQLGNNLPDSSAIFTVISAIILGVGHQSLKSSSAKTTETATPAPVSTTTTTTIPGTNPVVSAWSPGFTVTPCFQKGDSPLPITLQVQGGMDAAGKRSTLQIDWMDGAPAEDVALDAATGKAAVSHAYTYTQGASKYTGHSFYPEFTLIGSDGSKKSFNVDGKCCEIEVQSVKTA